MLSMSVLGKLAVEVDHMSKLGGHHCTKAAVDGSVESVSLGGDPPCVARANETTANDTETCFTGAYLTEPDVVGEVETSPAVTAFGCYASLAFGLLGEM